MQENGNPTAHDQDQDHRIQANTDRLDQQTALLKDIRNHFLPEAVEDRRQAMLRQTTRLLAKLLLGIAFIAGLWDVLGWYLSRYEIRTMADRYANIAHEMYHVEGNPDVALDFLNRAIELQENNAEYRFQRAYMDGMATVRHLLNLDRPLNKADLDAAHQSLAQAMFLKSLQPERVESYILEGQVYVVLKEFDRARQRIEYALELDPLNDFAHVRLATLLMEMEQVEAAETAVARALEINPGSKWAWLWQGVLLTEKRQDHVGAREAFQKALDIDPRFDLAWYNFAWTWVNAEPRDYRAAQEKMERALSLNPDYKEAYYAIGMYHGFQQNYPLAHVYMDKALAIDPDFLTARKWRGVIRREMGQSESAVADFDAAIQLDPMSGELYVRRAGAFEELGRLDEAMNDLRFAAELDPGNRRVWQTMGTVFIKAGDTLRAQDFYRKALDLDPNYAEAHAGMAEARAMLDDLDGALESLDLAMQTTGYRPERFLLRKGAIYERFDRHEAALEAYRTARTMDATLFEAWLAEARLAVAASRDEEALTAIAACLELRPDHAEARELRRAMTQSVR